MATKARITAKAIAKMSNTDFWEVLRSEYPNFRTQTAKLTSDIFTEKGFEALRMSDTNILNDFIGLSMRVAFQKLDIARAKNPLADKNIIQFYDTLNGGFIQRIAVNSFKPVSPKYLNLKNGDTTDPFKVRKADYSERFFGQNWNYQNWITIQDFEIKTIFVNEYGMGEFIAGTLAQLDNAYTLQEYVNFLECLNTAINSTKYPLKNTQKLTTVMADSATPTENELTNFILSVKNLISAMVNIPQTSAFNALGFNTVVDQEDYVMLLRAGIKNAISVNLLTGAFNPENLSLPIEVVEVLDFGGLQPFKEAEFITPLYPVYDENGVMIGYAEEEGAAAATIAEEEAFMKDPNADVIAVIMQRGMIFENKQNPYMVEPVRSVPGLYNNYWASAPNNAINVDPAYNFIVITSN